MNFDKLPPSKIRPTTFRLHPVIRNMMDMLVAKAGYKDRQDVLRTAVRQLYRKELRDHSYEDVLDNKAKKNDARKKLDEMVSAEDQIKYCKEVLNGEVDEIEGQIYCRYEEDGFEVITPINKIKEE